MLVTDSVAQRAAPRLVRRLAGPLIAIAVAITALTFTPPAADAAGPKVVIVVGPVGSLTASYISRAKEIAAQARGYGATVSEVYSPNATWARVKQVAQGANLFVYLGHGNGSPSPYGPFNAKKMDGLGLNPYAGSGNTTTAYYGEYYVGRDIHLAANAVVILNHLCYASGNSEPGKGRPSRAVARTRVDNYGAGFLKAGARTVFAYGHSSATIDPVRTVQDGPPDDRHLLVRPERHPHVRQQVLLGADARGGRLARSLPGRRLVSLRRRQHDDAGLHLALTLLRPPPRPTTAPASSRGRRMWSRVARGLLYRDVWPSRGPRAPRPVLRPRPMTDPHDAVRPLVGTRQYREFTAEPPSDAELDAITDVARWSGSSENSQPWRFIVIRSSATIRRLADAGMPQTRSLQTATAAVAIVLPDDPDRAVSYAYDEGRVAERMLVAAGMVGLGAGIGWIRPRMARHRSRDPRPAGRPARPDDRRARTPDRRGTGAEVGAGDGPPAARGRRRRGALAGRLGRGGGVMTWFTEFGQVVHEAAHLSPRRPPRRRRDGPHLRRPGPARRGLPGRRPDRRPATRSGRRRRAASTTSVAPAGPG